MNTDKSRKILSIKSRLESMSIGEIREKIWKSNNKFSVRHKLVKVMESDEGYMIKLNKLSGDQLDMLSGLFSGKKKLVHFKTKEHVAEFLAGIIKENTDVTKIDESIISSMNDVCESIKEQFSGYNPNDSMTWGANLEIADRYHGLYADILDKNKMFVSAKQMQMFAISKKVYEDNIPVEEGRKDIYTMVYEVLDEASIVLLASFIFGSLEDYSDSLRDKVYDYLQKNPNSPAVNMVAGDVTSDDMETLRRQFNYYDKQSFMASNSFMAFRKNNVGKICLIKYTGNNTYKFKELD